MPLRILLVDDHKIMRAGIRAIMEQSQEFAVIGEAGTGTEAIAECKQKHPDMIVMDIGLPLPGMNGIETTQVILRSAPATKVVMLSIYDDEKSVVRAIRSGAHAYVVKQASGRDLLEALRTVAAGGCYFSPSVSGRLLQCIRVGPHSMSASALEILAPRELQVFHLVAAGNGSKDIAVILDLGLETVRTYRKTMMRKLGVRNVAGVTQLAVAAGMAPPNGVRGDEKVFVP